MLINSPLPRAPQPYYHQGSALRSVRDADRPDRQWSKDKKVAGIVEALGRQVASIKQELGRLRRRIPGGSGGPGGSGAVDYAGEYDPGKSYNAKVIVRFTPDGEAAGQYISKKSVPAGVFPDTGGDYWDVFANGPQSVWA